MDGVYRTQFGWEHRLNVAILVISTPYLSSNGRCTFVINITIITICAMSAKYIYILVDHYTIFIQQRALYTFDVNVTIITICTTSAMCVNIWTIRCVQHKHLRYVDN